MYVAVDAAPPGAPWWQIVVGAFATVLVAVVAARGPVWVEKTKTRWGKSTNHTPATPSEKVATAEAVLQDWLKSAIRERDKAIKEVDRLNQRIKTLERELYQLGWDGRTG